MLTSSLLSKTGPGEVPGKRSETNTSNFILLGETTISREENIRDAAKNRIHIEYGHHDKQIKAVVIKYILCLLHNFCQKQHKWI